MFENPNGFMLKMIEVAIHLPCREKGHARPFMCRWWTVEPEFSTQEGVSWRLTTRERLHTAFHQSGRDISS